VPFEPTVEKGVNTPSQDNQRSKRLAAIAAGAVSAFVLSWFFRVPLVPVLVGIAVAAKLGSSENWRTGLLYGVMIGPSGYAVRVFLYPPDQAIVALWQKGLLLLAIAAIYGLVGIGINKLVTGRGSLMW
jgi:hypothetical protein